MKQVQCINALISLHADVNDVSPNGLVTPLLVALSGVFLTNEQSLEACRMLLAANAKPDQTVSVGPYAGVYPLTLARQNGTQKHVDLLQTAGASAEEAQRQLSSGVYFRDPFPPYYRDLHGYVQALNEDLRRRRNRNLKVMLLLFVAVLVAIIARLFRSFRAHGCANLPRGSAFSRFWRLLSSHRRVI